MLGIVMGGYLASLTTGEGYSVAISERTKLALGEWGITDFSGLIHTEIFNVRFFTTSGGFVVMVLGGFLVGFGARYGGGCTSGHAISGLFNLLLPSLIAVIGFFAGRSPNDLLHSITHFILKRYYHEIYISRFILWFCSGKVGSRYFDSFHMYGIIGSAVIIGITSIQIIKRFQMKDMEGEQISVGDKEMILKRYIIGGSLFGLGWALLGACPGPMYALVGNGCWIILVPMFFAFLGTMTYGMIREKLPH